MYKLQVLFLSTFLGVVLVLNPVKTKACAWDPTWDMPFYSFLEPEMMPTQTFADFHFSFDLLYNSGSNEPESTGLNKNLRSWKTYFQNKYSENEIREVVYEMDLEAAEAMKAGNLSKEYVPNNLAVALSKGADPDFCKYICLAKACEPFNEGFNPFWNETPELDSASHPLAKALETAYVESKTNFYKLRYGFQLVRILHYNHHFPEALKAYQELALPVQDSSSPLWLDLSGLHAGILKRLGQRTAANLAFVRVFLKDKSQIRSCKWGVSILSQKDFSASLAACNTKEEKAVFYFFRAIAPHSIPAQDLKIVHQLAPESGFAEMLLLREVNKLELQILKFPHHIQGGWRTEAFEKGWSEANVQIRQLQGLILEILASGKMQDESLWRLAETHLDFLGGNRKLAMAKIDQLSASADPRSTLLKLVYQIDAQQHINPETANAVSLQIEALRPQLPSNQFIELITWRDEHFRDLLDAKGETGLAFLSRGEIWKLSYISDTAIFQDLIQLLKKPNPNPWEQEMIGRLDLKNDKVFNFIERKFDLNYLEFYLGQAYLAIGQPGKASQFLKAKAPDDHQRITTGSLFDFQFNDLLPQQLFPTTNFNYLFMAKLLHNMQKKTQDEGPKAGLYHFHLANAWYNLSDFGRFWFIADNFTGSNPGWYYEESENEPYPLFPNLDLSISYHHYLKASQLSDQVEIKAAALFLAEKCLRKNSWIESFSQFKDRNHFQKLHEMYSETNAYRFALAECGAFEYFCRQ